MFLQTLYVISKYATISIKRFQLKMLQQLFHHIKTMTVINNIQELNLIQSTMITTSTQIQRVMMKTTMTLLITQLHQIKLMMLFKILLDITNKINQII